jgi:hypothetical protein
MQQLAAPSPKHLTTVVAVMMVLLSGGCSGNQDAENELAGELGISTTTIATPTVTAAKAPPPTTTMPADVSPSRIEAGDLAPTRYGTSEFAFGLTFDLPNGAWSTDTETRNVIHLAQSPEPDFSSAVAYDFPLLVLLALPQLDDSAVVDIVQTIDDIGFTTASEITIDGKSTVTTDGASRNNPPIDAFQAEDQTVFAGLGGYWYWDPDLNGVLYRVWIIDLSRGTLLAWYAAPRNAFATGVDTATQVVESIRFTN